MEISINGKKADIILESEKTLGEVLTGIYNWLEESGLYVSGVEADGKTFGSLSLDEAFTLPLEGIASVNITASGWADLMLEALGELRGELQRYRQDSAIPWENTPAALFLRKNAADLYGTAVKTLEGGFSPEGTLSLIDERIREIQNPAGEIADSRTLIEETARRLEDLPLDMQTGKDSRASETIAFFSALAEKIFRLIFLFRQSGIDPQKIALSSAGSGEDSAGTLKEYIEEFSAALRELISAYENKDTVLVGDLAEYELAPRLLRLSSELAGLNNRTDPARGGKIR